MESSFLHILFFLASFAMIIKICLKLNPRKSETQQRRPPGSSGLPFIGETLQFFLSGRRGTPEKFYMERMNKYSDIAFKTSFLGLEAAVLCGASGNKFLFSNVDNKVSAGSGLSSAKKFFPYLTKSTETTKESTHRLRGIFNRVFGPAFLHNTAVGIVDAVAKEHFKNHWDGEKEVRVLSMVEIFIFTVSTKLFLNIEDVNQVKDLSQQFEYMVSALFSIPINFPGTSYNRGIKGLSSITKKLLAIMKQRRTSLMDQKSEYDVHRQNNYLSSSLTDIDDKGKLMSEQEIMDHILLLLLAGRDSIMSTITNTINYLAEYPHVYDKVLKEQRSIAEAKPAGEPLNWKDLQNMNYTWNVVCEVLRLRPPIPGNFREALTDFHYSDFFIPKGSKLLWSAHTTHKNPEYFPEPEKFDPSRFEGGHVPYTFVPFGGGPLTCPGKDIARLVILIFMYNVVGKFRWEMVIPDEKIVALPIPFPAKRLPVRLFPH